MDKKYVSGQEVKVRSSQGVQVRVVVQDLGNVLTVCKPEELDRAAREHRDPAAVGLPKTDIISDA